MGFCSRIGAYIVGEIAAGAENDFNGISKGGGREHFGYDVVPRGACAGEQNGRALKAVFRGKLACDRNGAREECANGGLVLKNAFINFNAAERDGIAPAGEGFKRCL
jgi:hypothetical protein